MIGPPASGKTTLAQWLSATLPARLVKEDFGGNPFLAGSFMGRRELSLPSQLYFLFSRLGQLSKATWPGEGLTVSDYGFCQDAVYARHSLSEQEMETYGRVAGPIHDLVKPPDLVIHLDGDVETLLARIAVRGRGYETAFHADFLASMRAAYAELTAGLGCAVMYIDTGRRDLLSEGGRQELLGRIREELA
jgi:deoxyguanosine kinase